MIIEDVLKAAKKNPSAFPTFSLLQLWQNQTHPYARTPASDTVCDLKWHAGSADRPAVPLFSHSCRLESDITFAVELKM